MCSTWVNVLTSHMETKQKCVSWPHNYIKSCINQINNNFYSYNSSSSLSSSSFSPHSSPYCCCSSASSQGWRDTLNYVYLLPPWWYKIRWSLVVHKTFLQLHRKTDSSVLLNNWRRLDIKCNKQPKKLKSLQTVLKKCVNIVFSKRLLLFWPQ